MSSEGLLPSSCSRFPASGMGPKMGPEPSGGPSSVGLRATPLGSKMPSPAEILLVRDKKINCGTEASIKLMQSVYH